MIEFFKPRELGEQGYELSIVVGDSFDCSVEFSISEPIEQPSIECTCDYIEIRNVSYSDEVVLVDFDLLDVPSDSRGQIEVHSSEGEVIHCVVPRLQIVNKCMCLLGGENPIHTLDEYYTKGYPEMLGKFTSECGYFLEFPEYIRVLDTVCGFDNGVFSSWVNDEPERFFKNIMAGDGKFTIADSSELRSKVELYNSMQNLDSVAISDIEDVYVVEYEEKEAVDTPPSVFDIQP